jgi:immune inhibitor A
MRKKILSMLVIVSMLALVLPAIAGGATVASKAAADTPAKARPDNKPHPLGEKAAALKQTALEKQLKEKVTGKPDNSVVEVAEGQFVKLDLEGEDPVFTMLGEFADFPHNNIAEPDRQYDNSTIWVEDFSSEYFDQLLYDDTPGVNSMANFFLEQSSGLYTVYGDATEWATVPEGYQYYDDSVGGLDTSTNVWLFLQDMADAWYADQIAAGKTPAEIAADLATFDILDRYDYDGDGNFNEPDGYIDHFQALHAGEGEEAGGGAMGDEAIWSHSWYANYADIDKVGPSDDFLLGGLKIGDSNYWIGDYTIQPENGGVGVFTHEFSHDLGVPDLYDYNYRENGTGFWTLMSSGSWLSDGTVDIGSKPNHLRAWEKFLLGWLDYGLTWAGEKGTYVLGPSSYNSSALQGLFVVLPKQPVTEFIGAPYAGSMFYFSGAANNLNNKMTKAFTLGAGATLSAKVKYGIETGYDYASLIVSTDAGANWDTVPTNLSNSEVEANSIDGFSNGWVDLTADLSAYAGDVMLGFRYVTDGGVSELGFMIDEIAITGYGVDGAEVDAGWTYQGFRATTGVEDKEYSHYYLAENVVYWGYDATLKGGPYNFGFLNNPMLGNFVERFSYQDGMLVSYWNTRYNSNDTDPKRPGTGMLLYVDSHPAPLSAPGGIWRNRVQTYDSTFSIDRTESFTLHRYSKPSKLPSQPGVREFNDLTSYWTAANPYGSVKTAKAGVKIRIDGVSASGQFMQITVSAAKNATK